MKKLSLLMLILSIGLFTLMSCDGQEDCESTEEAFIVSSEIVDTADVNQAVDVDVEFDVSNGCGAFSGGVMSTDTSTNVVSVVTNALYSGCVCTQAIVRVEGTLNYIPTKVGTYIFEFKQDDVVNHRDTLVVE